MNLQNILSRITYSIVSLSFLGLLFAPALVQAKTCGLSNPGDPGCTGPEICEIDAGGVYNCVNVKSGYGLESTFTGTGLGKTDDLKGSIASIINIVLGFLGIVAVIIILAGGFKWMTAAGNEEAVTEARGYIKNGVIGLLVVFAAWAIASFVIGQLGSATAT
jgi:hypothetical protein